MHNRLAIGMWGLLAFWLVSPSSFADTRWHSPQTFSRYAESVPPFVLLSPEQALRDFIRTHAPEGDGYAWEQVRRFGDETHLHYQFRLTYEGTPFPEIHLKIHLRRGPNGTVWVDFASSNWKKRVLGPDRAWGVGRGEALVEEWTERLRTRDAEPKVRAQSVYWADEEGQVHPAVELKIAAPARGVFRHLFVDPVTGTPLAERGLLRGINANVYTVSPLANPTNFENVTLGGLGGGATTLSTARFNVRREQNTTTPELSDVDPNTDFSAAGGFSTSPATASYNYDCEGNATECPNQGFDAVNTYHHLQEFRSWVESHMGTLGLVPSEIFAKDPIDIIVNIFSVDLDGDGDQDDVNNAFYIPLSCTNESNAPDACIWFFRAENVEDPACGAGEFQYFHLSRETVVVTHEYQHYVTDMMTGLLQGQGAKFNVADGLHEGYSDYFAVSFTSDDSGSDQTLVGASAFRNCAPIQREIGEISVLELLESDTAALYTVGTTWASGLWKLRDTLGNDGADLVALKAMTFLPVDAGFVDSVESLVKADAVLNSGANAATIRTLFYNTLRFSGGQTLTFRDPARGVVEVGFQSCATGMGTGAPTGMIFLFWAWLTLLGGRWVARR